MHQKSSWDVVVLGAGGRQAQAMLQAAARQQPLTRWLCVDRAWAPGVRTATEALGARVVVADVLADDARLAELVGGARVAANMVGPYYRTAGPVLDACIAANVDYLDICDDADAAAIILARDDDARRARIHALTGMGATPGTSNVLARVAYDAIGGADTVEIAWINDMRDVSPAVLEHFWHIFEPYVAEGPRKAVPRWDDLSRRSVEFGEAVGTHLTFELAHSELVTLPRFLGVETVTNYGGLAPADSLMMTWAMARLGAGASAPLELTAELHDGYRRLAAELADDPRAIAGLRVDVLRDGSGIRFSSASPATMEESTGEPAAAGIHLLLDRRLPETGVSAPECLKPTDFFDAMAKVRGTTGTLTAHLVRAGVMGERVSIRELLLEPAAVASRLGLTTVF